jgi:ABC-type xylose transport system permease subunit
MKQLKILSICGLVCALVCAAGSLIVYFGDWYRLSVVSVFGLFLGFIAAPEIDPKAFKKPWLIQLICGAIAGLLAGFSFSLPATDLVYTTIIGGFIGWSANLWVKHVTLP